MNQIVQSDEWTTWPQATEMSHSLVVVACQPKRLPTCLRPSNKHSVGGSEHFPLLNTLSVSAGVFRAGRQDHPWVLESFHDHADGVDHPGLLCANEA